MSRRMFPMLLGWLHKWRGENVRDRKAGLGRVLFTPSPFCVLSPGEIEFRLICYADRQSLDRLIRNPAVFQSRWRLRFSTLPPNDRRLPRSRDVAGHLSRYRSLHCQRHCQLRDRAVSRAQRKASVDTKSSPESAMCGFRPFASRDSFYSARY
jgi:hypothetical protein